MAFKNLLARKLRTVLTLVAIVVALILVILLTTILSFTEQSMDDELAKYAGGGQIYVTSQQIGGFSGQEFPPINGSLREAEALALVSNLSDSVDLSRTTPILFRQLASPPFPNAPPQALAVGIDPERIEVYLGNDLLMNEGEAEFSGPRAMEVILGDLAAGSFEGANAVGSDISLAGKSVRVVGRVGSETQFDRISANVVLMPLETAQSIFNQEGTISALLITASSLGDVGLVAGQIRESNPDLSVISQEEIANSLDDALAGQRRFFALINNTLYIVAAVIVLIVMVMAVSERTREIGTLRALGASKRVVLSTVVFEATALGLIGGIVAVPVSFLLDLILDFGLTQVARPTDLIQVVIFVALLSAIASIFPAWRAMRISPVEALRYE